MHDVTYLKWLRVTSLARTYLESKYTFFYKRPKEESLKKYAISRSEIDRSTVLCYSNKILLVNSLDPGTALDVVYSIKSVLYSLQNYSSTSAVNYSSAVE